MTLASYPYLGMTLALLGLMLVGVIAYPDGRRVVLLSGALQAPLGFLSIFFVPDYWEPVRVACFGAGPEDLLFSFASGGLVWLIASAPWRARLRFEIEPRRIVLRYLGFALPGVAALTLLWSRGVGPMDATIVISVTGGAVLAYWQRRFVKLSMVGFAGFGLLYTVTLKGAFILWPTFQAQWSHGSLWGLTILGVPLEEVVWAAGGGALWPLFMTYLLSARIDNDEGRRPG